MKLKDFSKKLNESFSIRVEFNDPFEKKDDYF